MTSLQRRVCRVFEAGRTFKFRLAAVLCLVLLTGVTEGLAQRYTVARYGQAEGLGDLNVHRLLQDRAGTLWVATESGLFRFNGKQFEEVTLGLSQTSPYIFHLAEDGAGRMWAACDSGLYVVEHGVAREVQEGGKPIDVRGGMFPLAGAGGGVGLIAKNRLLAVEEAGGTWKVKLYGMDAALARRKISVVQWSRGDGVWLATDSGVVSIDRRTGRTIRVVDEGDTHVWISMLEDLRGDLWLARGGEVAVAEPGSSTVRDVSRGMEESLERQRYFDFGEDAQGRVLMLLGEGVARWEGERWRVFGAKEGLGGSPAEALLADRDGNVWIAHFGHGLVKWLGYGRWEHWTPEEGLASAVVWGMARNGAGELVVADYKALSRMGGGGLLEPVTGLREESPGRALVRSGDGSLWLAGSSKWVTRFDAKGDGRQYFELPVRSFNLLAATNGEVGVATVSGMWRARLTDGRWEMQPEQDPVLAKARLYEIAEQAGSGRILATSDHDLFCRDGGVWKRVDVSGTELTGSGGANIAAASDGTLWLSGSFPGALHAQLQAVAGGGLKLVEMERVMKPELSSNRIVEIGTDRRGWVWISTDRGMDVLTGQGWRWLLADDGLLWNDTNSYGFFDDPDGSVWIGSSEGLSHLIDPVAEFQPLPLPIRIASVQQGEKAVEVAGSVKLAWTSKDLRLTFDSPSFRNERSTRFRYRMEGVDGSWVEAATGEARYPRLAPGTYQFEVFAENAPRHERSEVLRMGVTISPPWWRSWWFEALLGLLLLAALGSLLAWREMLQAKRRVRLEALIAERTAELQKETEDLKEARAELTIAATHDHLTRLLNRGAIMDALFKEMDRIRRPGGQLVLVLLDIDHFKRINDTYGHGGGDQVLVQAAARMLRSVRTYDSVGRYGGEEFLLVLPGLEAESEWARVRDFHQAICGEEYDLDGVKVKVTCSFGVVSVQRGILLPEQAIALADEALYRAKDKGRNRIEWAMPAAAQELKGAAR